MRETAEHARFCIMMPGLSGHLRRAAARLAQACSCPEPMQCKLAAAVAKTKRPPKVLKTKVRKPVHFASRHQRLRRGMAATQHDLKIDNVGNLSPAAALTVVNGCASAVRGVFGASIAGGGVSLHVTDDAGRDNL